MRSTTPGDAHQAQQLQRLAEASTELDSLEAVDLRLRLDNALLGRRIETDVRNALSQVPGWQPSDVAVTFFPGYIAVDAEGRLDVDGAPPRAVELAGEAQLAYTSGRVSWLTRFHTLLNASSGTTRAADPDERAALLAALNLDLETVLAGQDDAFIEIDPMPLGILETGIRLRSPFQGTRAESSLLEGVLTTRGSATLIEPETTTFALDLGFVPGLPDCQAGVSVGRATFASTVRNREPVRPVSGRAAADDSRVFFTDILEARASTTVVHYWLADGQPASLGELGVEPSARWRTWSGRPDEPSDVRRWQVLVVEKPTGCILARRSLLVERPPLHTAALPQGLETTGFDELRAAFLEKTDAFPEPAVLEGAAAIDVAKAFFAAALSESMYDLHLTSRPQVQTDAALPIEARVQAFPAEALSCEAQDCGVQRVCTLDFDDCPVERDTRDCTSCLFRNPLNNRCMREAEDPICIAARDGENLRLEERRQACIAGKTRARDACVLARERDLASCQERTSREVSACTEQAEAMAGRRSDMNPIGRLTGQARLAGAIEFDFSEFRIEDDLQRMRMRMTVNADLSAQGRLAFQPAVGLGPLTECLTARGDAFEAPLALPLWQGGLASGLVVDGASLRADWSGLVQELTAEPPLVDRFLEDNPQLLSTCAFDVNSSDFEGLLTGTGAELLRGSLAMDMQPEPTRISLLPAYLSSGSDTWTGKATIGTDTVSYRLEERTPAVAGR